MRVLVIGGTGAFGSRLCDLLARDGCDVVVAGRGPAGRTPRFVGNASPSQLDFEYVTLDRDGDLAAISGYDVVVDAAGPFHAYGQDPYRIPRAAIASGAHYFDLCDNADFCAGITVLDGAAQAAGVVVLSGMSSVPAVSSAAVSAMCSGARPLMIESAILPGNKAPRGRSVVDSILHQTGTMFEVRQGGQKGAVRSWSDPKTFDLGDDRRQAWRIEVPDQRLFPDHFDCPTVTFRAGLELGVMRYGLAALSWVRAVCGFGMPRWIVGLVMSLAKLLAPFGTDRGGMVVEVTLAQDGGFVRKTWRLRATSGDGPYTPAIAVRAACRDISRIAVGARAAVAQVPLERLEACLDDLAIETDQSQTAVTPPFRSVLGPAFDTLAEPVRATHDTVVPRVLRGQASVVRGAGIMARIAAVLFGFPPSTPEIDVEVTKTPIPTGEVWTRRFGTRTFRSVLRPTPRGMSERFGALTFDLDLNVKDGALCFPVKSGRIGWCPIPRILLPHSIASETSKDGVFHFDVELRAPTGAPLVHYRGWLQPAVAFNRAG